MLLKSSSLVLASVRLFQAVLSSPNHGTTKAPCTDISFCFRFFRDGDLSTFYLSGPAPGRACPAFRPKKELPLPNVVSMGSPRSSVPGLRGLAPSRHTNLSCLQAQTETSSIR